MTKDNGLFCLTQIGRLLKHAAARSGRPYTQESLDSFRETPEVLALATRFVSDLESMWGTYLDVTADTAPSPAGAERKPAASEHAINRSLPKPFTFPDLDSLPAAAPSPGAPVKIAMDRASPRPATPASEPSAPVPEAAEAAPTPVSAPKTPCAAQANPSPPSSAVSASPPPPMVSFPVANGKAGQPYEARLAGVSQDGRPVHVSSVRFKEDWGLTFTEADQALRGVPSQDGETELAVYYRMGDDPSGTTHSGRAFMVVTPDPRSLWKNLPSDRSEPFWKDDSENRILIGTHRKAVAASQRGRSHAHKGLCRDDDFYLDDVAGWTIGVVADGAGSAKYSRRGAQVASREAGSFLAQLLAGEEGARIIAAGNRRLAEASDEAEKNLRTAMYQSVGYSAHRALQALVKETETPTDQGTPVTLRDLDTTLLVAISHPLDHGVVVGTYWVGDGAIAIYDKQAGVTLCGKPDGGEYSGGTRFLAPPYVAQGEMWERSRGFAIPHMDALLLMSDGVSDPKFPSEAALAKTENWQTFLAELGKETGFPEHIDGIDGRLLAWLDFWAAGEHDDRTIAIVW